MRPVSRSVPAPAHLGNDVLGVLDGSPLELDLRLESVVEGDINLLGLLGIDREVRNGYSGIRARFRIRGDAPPEKLAAIVEQSRARSAVYDVLSNGCPVALEIDAG